MEGNSGKRRGAEEASQVGTLVGPALGCEVFWVPSLWRSAFGEWRENVVSVSAPPQSLRKKQGSSKDREPTQTLWG